MIRADDEKWLPQGAESLHRTQTALVGVLESTAHTLAAMHTTLMLDIETFAKPSGNGDVIGLIICDTASGRTAIVPMTLSPAVVRLRGIPHYLGYSGGSARLFDAIWEEAVSFVEAKADMDETR